MACTTILVGKKASYDGSTMIARNDDSGSGHFTAKKFTVVHPEDLPKVYRSVLSHVEVPLPEGAMRFTAMPNAVEGKGIWAASGVNAANVDTTPAYLANTTGEVSTDNFYWVSRMIAAMADASYAKSLFHIERYEEAVLSAAHALVNQYDAKLAAAAPAERAALREEANLALAAMIQEKASDTLGKVLFELSNQMKNAYSRSDA